MNKLQCYGTESDLGKCAHGGWGKKYCYYPANVVCGTPQEKKQTITKTFGVITSPGFPSVMNMAHNEWMFFTAPWQTRLFLDFEVAFFIRSIGSSSLVVETGDKSVLLDVKNEKLKKD